MPQAPPALATAETRFADAVLRYPGKELIGILREGSAEQVRKVLRGMIARATLYREKVVVQFVPPLWQSEAVRMNGGGSVFKPELALGGAPNGIRTRVSALKGPRPRPLDDRDKCERIILRKVREAKFRTSGTFAL